MKRAPRRQLAEELKLPPPSDVVLERFLVLDCEYSESDAETIRKSLSGHFGDMRG